MAVPIYDKNNKNLVHILHNSVFSVGYSESLCNPLWVTYKIKPRKFKYIRKRPLFKLDSRSKCAVSYWSYKGSGYSRGHLAPNYLIASRYGRKAQKETFLMTNITPQKQRFNSKIWQRLEEVSADFFSKWYPEIWVITGPIFPKKVQTFKKKHIAIPKAFYKIFIRENKDSKPEMLAFIIPQDAAPKDSLSKYVVSVDAVEKVTGLDFNSALDDRVEDQVELRSRPEHWQLSKVANLPARY